MSFKLKRWIVTAVDFDADGQCDGKARILTILASKENAQNYVLEDMREYVDNNVTRRMLMDEDKMRVTDIDAGYSCEWNIEEVELELTDDEVIEIGANRYVEGIQHGIDMAKEEN